jgi:hypothetical protein
MTSASAMRTAAACPVLRKQQRLHSSKLPLARRAGLAPILVQLSKDANDKYLYNPVAVNLLTEVVKTAFAFCVLLATVRTPTPSLSAQAASTQTQQQRRRCTWYAAAQRLRPPVPCFYV